MNDTPKKLGRYQIIREIGRGSMGVVYKADDPVIEREVAIKAIQLSFAVNDEEKDLYLNRFYREAKAAGKLNHPNIVTIYDVDEDKTTGTPFIVMEYLEGTSLQEMLSQGMLLPLKDVNDIIIQVADALNYAHNQNVVHRDIKSGNIMLLPGMKSKIMDFGIARMASSDLTKSGQFMGTPNYMSPEQIDGKKAVDGRSDLFSLGVIYYLLLTGERPFSGDSFTSISYKIVHVDPIPPRTINPAVPEAYNTILGRLLAKDPNERYPSGADLIQDLRKLNGAAGTIDTSALDQMRKATAAKAMANLDTKPSVIKTANKKLPPYVFKVVVPAALVLLFAIVAIAFLLPKNERAQTSTPQQQPHIIKPTSALPPKENPNEGLIRTKWNLALNYSKNGFYDKSIEELNEILKLDPKNEEAQKYLVTVQELKEKAHAKKKGRRKRP
jgi:eukaryotic-like serine/threonine-protein kinase